MEEILDIAEVARRTGLTARALRFYEARGLLAPLRTHKGRRLYGAAALERINQIVALKRAGLTLAQIQQMTARRPLDLARLIDAQLEALGTRHAETAEARQLLLSVKFRIDRGEPVDVATFCSLIRQGDAVMEPEGWKSVAARYFTPEERGGWDESLAALPASFEEEDYSSRWLALTARVEAALPIDPASEAAQAFVDEWFALLKPFSEIATPAMWNGTIRMYDDMERWQGAGGAGFSKRVWDFIGAAARARLAAGGRVDGPAWLNQGGGNGD